MTPILSKTMYRNLDNEKYYDSKLGTYIMDFDEKQKEAIEYAINHMFHPELFTYTHIPAENMWHMISYIKNYFLKKEFEPIKLWKIGQSALSEKACESCVYALEKGISMVDDIENINQYSDEILYLVSVAASYGENYCKVLYPGIKEEEFEDTVQKMINRKKLLYTKKSTS